MFFSKLVRLELETFMMGIFKLRYCLFKIAGWGNALRDDQFYIETVFFLQTPTNAEQHDRKPKAIYEEVPSSSSDASTLCFQSSYAQWSQWHNVSLANIANDESLYIHPSRARNITCQSWKEKTVAFMGWMRSVLLLLHLGLQGIPSPQQELTNI